MPPKFIDIERVDNNLWISSDIKTLSIHQIENLDETLNFDFTDTGSNVLSTINRIDNLYYDKENNIMYGGTSGRGLYTFDLESNTVNRITKEDGLLSNNIYDFEGLTNLHLLLFPPRSMSPIYVYTYMYNYLFI